MLRQDICPVGQERWSWAIEPTLIPTSPHKYGNACYQKAVYAKIGGSEPEDVSDGCNGSHLPSENIHLDTKTLPPY